MAVLNVSPATQGGGQPTDFGTITGPGGAVGATAFVWTYRDRSLDKDKTFSSQTL
jgi:hypothetical protein